jgi:hypothetical protein
VVDRYASFFTPAFHPFAYRPGSRRLQDEQRCGQIVLVLDNLNTHTLATLYEVFPVAQARRLCQFFEAHYTPKHGSWLNRTEIELSALDRPGLSQRLAPFLVSPFSTGRGDVAFCGDQTM